MLRTVVFGKLCDINEKQEREPMSDGLLRLLRGGEKSRIVFNILAEMEAYPDRWDAKAVEQMSERTGATKRGIRRLISRFWNVRHLQRRLREKPHKELYFTYQLRRLAPPGQDLDFWLEPENQADTWCPQDIAEEALREDSAESSVATATAGLMRPSVPTE